MSETKPACDIFFDCVYTGTAAQDTKITVLGEAQSGTGLSPDQTIVVDVLSEELGTLMSVQAHSGVGYPDVTLTWASVQSRLNAAFDLYSGVTGTPAQFRDSELQVLNTLQKVFATREFSWGATANPLASIPIEAVKEIKYDEPLEIRNSNGDVSTQLAGSQGGPAFTLLGPGTSSGTGADLSGAQNAEKKAVRSLYLQALAADRYEQTGTPASGSDATATGTGGFNFLENDTVTVYTELQLTKTRVFVPDTVSVVGGTSGGLKFAVDGSDVVIGAGTTADDEMESEPLPHLIAWKLRVKGSPTAPQAGSV
jgi:hypothetical protein